MVQIISGVNRLMVGSTALLLRTQTHMEELAEQTTTVQSMTTLTTGASEMKMAIGTTVASYQTVATYPTH